MNSYNRFAYVYSQLNDNINYEVRSDYISDFFVEKGITDGTILDLACGCGEMSAELIKKGYNIIGIDYSNEMLEIASNNLLKFNNSFTLLKSKMQNFTLPKVVDSCICSLDSINHLNSLKDVKSTFKCVYDSLRNNGLFIFDVNTIYKHNEILANNTFIFDEDDFYLVWDNEKIDNKNIRIMLDIFEYNGDSYDRYSEEFIETAYSIDEIMDSLKTAGFTDINVYDNLTRLKPNEKSERLYFICKKV